jgi:hypothetical protein
VLLDDLDIRDLKDAALAQTLSSVLNVDKGGNGAEARKAGVRVATIDNYQASRSHTGTMVHPHTDM